MALVFQMCETCGTRYGSRTVRSKHCSSACRQTAYRASKQQKPKPDTQKHIIKTQEGNANMATQTPVPQAPMLYAFSESDYQALCRNAKALYDTHVEAPHSTLKGAIVEFRTHNIIDTLEKYHELRAERWTLAEDKPHAPSVQSFDTPLQQFTVMYMVKPPKARQADLEAIYADVLADYEKDLEFKLEQEVERQIDLVIKAKEREAQREVEQARLKLEQDTRDELAASRMKLRAELIASGKLSAEGHAQ